MLPPIRNRGYALMLAAWALVGFGCSDSEKKPNVPSQDGVDDKVRSLVESIDTEDYLTATFIASGAGTVRVVLLDKPEVKELIALGEAAIPALAAHLQRPNGIRKESNRLIFFVVLGEMGSRRGVPPLLSYLESLEVDDEKKVLSPWHPMPHAFEALKRLIPDLETGGSALESYRGKDTIIAEARRKLK